MDESIHEPEFPEIKIFHLPELLEIELRRLTDI
jgi:hypothetical protein